MRLQVPGSEFIVDIGTRKQLFVDDYIIETTRWIVPRLAETARWVQPPARARTDLDGWSEATDSIQGDVPGHLLRATAFVTRNLNQPERYEGNPIMQRAHPWEGRSAPHPTDIIYDEEDGIWKMWYLGVTVDEFPKRKIVYNTMYATSEDGIAWERPTLDVVKDRDGNDTNIVNECKCQFVIEDDDADPSRRYKMGHGPLLHWDPPIEAAVYHSPDGIHWTPDPGPAESDRGDETLSIMFDPVSRKYLGFCRNVYPEPWLTHRTERSIHRMQSNDLIHWSMSAPIIDKDPMDPFDTDFYGLQGMYYESMYLGFVNIHRTGPDHMEVWLSHSRDSFHWERIRAGPFLPRGSDGSWEWGMAMMFQAPMRVGDELWFYYTGVAGLHDGGNGGAGLGLAKLRPDGFVSIDAIDNAHRSAGRNYPPTLMTRPLKSPGNRLVVNAVASGGYLDAELLTTDGQVIDGYSRADCDTFKGDSLAHTFTWKGNADIGGCIPVRVRFYMDNAKLFALQIPEG